jgi:putative DNA primase/helicase
MQTAGTAPSYEVAGTLDGWRDDLARYAVGNSRLGLALSIPFVGPLLYLFNEESGGFHLVGGSSTGKTTALYCAASAWGVAVHSWRATDNAAEGLARGASDAFLALDEVSQADGRAVDAMAYMLGNGAGKARMRRDASARPIITWRLPFLSTGETGLAAKMQEGGRRARAGQEVRVVEIPADAGAGRGIFEDLHGFASGDALARHLRLAAEQHKGHAARSFLAQITENLNATAEAVAAARDAWIRANLQPEADGQVSRVARRFGLIAAAGELAAGLRILPWPEGEAERAATRCFGDWLRARGGHGPTEVRDGIAQVRAFLEAHGSSRFEPAWIKEDHRPDAGAQMEDTLRRTINRAGFRREDADGHWKYFVLPEIWRQEVCKGLDARAIAQAMAERGWLERGEGKNLARKVRVPEIGDVRVYVVRADFLSSEEGGTHAGC